MYKCTLLKFNLTILESFSWFSSCLNIPVLEDADSSSKNFNNKRYDKQIISKILATRLLNAVKDLFFWNIVKIFVIDIKQTYPILFNTLRLNNLNIFYDAFILLNNPSSVKLCVSNKNTFVINNNLRKNNYGKTGNTFYWSMGRSAA